MIGALKGSIYSIKKNPIILMVIGVGYAVSVSSRYISSHQSNQEALLFIHTHVREESFDLYGFETDEELTLFESLLTVSGIGPKTALLVLNHNVKEIEQAILQANVNFFTGIPRLGKKNAQKIIIELKHKIGSGKDIDLTDDSSKETKDLIDALVSMGFSNKESVEAIHKMPHTLTTIKDQLQWALKNLGKHA